MEMTQTLREQVARLIDPVEFENAERNWKSHLPDASRWIKLRLDYLWSIQSAYDRADAILALIQPQWMPIESAPMDGSEFLSYDPPDPDEGYDAVIRVIRWSEEFLSWVAEADYCPHICPTHWLPLPPAPEVK